MARAKLSVGAPKPEPELPKFTPTEAYTILGRFERVSHELCQLERELQLPGSVDGILEAINDYLWDLRGRFFDDSTYVDWNATK